MRDQRPPIPLLNRLSDRTRAVASDGIDVRGRGRPRQNNRDPASSSTPRRAGGFEAPEEKGMRVDRRFLTLLLMLSAPVITRAVPLLRLSTPEGGWARGAGRTVANGLDAGGRWRTPGWIR
jgi:hypothetical protein